MNLIGIYIHHESKGITKVLKPGWFPFGDYPAPEGDRIIDIPFYPREIEDIYSPSHGVKISVSAIVGKNGSGKSTLLDLLYRIINNFAIRIIGVGKTQGKYRHLNFVYGVYADLYYKIGRLQYRIRCRNTEITFAKADGEYFKDLTLSQTKSNKVLLSKFFYTIATNYSLYAYDPDDYRTERHDDIPDEKNNGEWIDGLFHKNDGYLTPIVLTPFREDGSIKGRRERHLAEQRINAMALMAEAHGTDFLPGYQAWKISVSLISDFQKERTKSLQESIDRHSHWMNASLMIDTFQEVWQQYITAKIGRFYERKDIRRYRLAVFYLAYKSIKLAMTYEDYAHAFQLSKDNKEYLEADRQREYYEHILKSRAETLVAKIYEEIKPSSEEHNHLVLKIEQTWQDIKHYASNKDAAWSVSRDVDVVRWLSKNKVHTYSDLFRIMPPPYLKVTLTFRKRNPQELLSQPDAWTSIGKEETLTLASMSSGERHLLYALSYVLYHIKNLQSVKSDRNRMPYKNICLIFDEVEMFLHPEYQRRFVSMLLESLEWAKIHGEKIKSIQLIIATHSPFTLTDIFTHNTLYLKDGHAEKVNEESFGANYYDMLANSFFFDSSPVGEIASRYIAECTKERNVSRLKKKLGFIGDRLLANYIFNQIRRNQDAEEE